MSDEEGMLLAKLATVTHDKHAGRGDWDRLSEIQADLHRALDVLRAAELGNGLAKRKGE